MDGGDDFWGEVGAVYDSPFLGDLEARADEGFCGGGSEEDEDVWLDGIKLGHDPRAAGFHFGDAGALVEASFSLLLPFEMFHCIGEVGFFALDSGVDQEAVEELACGADEGFSAKVLAVAGLFAYDHDTGVGGSFTEDGAGRFFIERALFAAARGFSKRLDILTNETGGG